MDSTFLYAESARRKAKKMKALAQGAGLEPAGAAGAPGAGPASPAVPAPGRVRPPRAVRVAKPGQPAAPGATRPAIRRPAGAETLGGGSYRKPQARPPQAAPPAPRAVAPPQAAARRPAARTPATALKANEERLLLESKELDLFGTGKASKVSVCPDCQHEAVKVVCLGIPVRACLECKGVWLSYPVVREFAREQEWFLQLGPAIQLAIDKKKKTGL
jgi:hypothetical protein